MNFTNHLALCAALIALPAIGVAQTTETPPGTYLVYAEADGTAFISLEPARADADRWPLAFHYFQGGVSAGSARATAAADCTASRATASIAAVFGPDGQPVAAADAMTPIVFDRASQSAGDIAIVDFLCGDTNARLAQSSAPIFGAPEAVSRAYVALRALGLGDRLARDIAIRDPATNDALIGTTVPENLRERVRALAGGER